MKLASNTTTIGFIGIGVMGKSMAGHLMKAGYTVMVYNRTKEKAQELLEQGALWQQNISELAAQCQVVITLVGDPRDVEEVYLSPQGLVNNAKAGTYLVDMTTSSPKLAVKIHQAAQERGLYALDAPVSGGDIGAREARLAIMIGSDEQAYEDMKPIFDIMGKNVIRQGGPGAGQHTKMCNQIAIASTMIGVCEAIIYAKKAGLDPALVLKSIETGAAASFSLSNLAPRMLADNFAPGFYIKHFIKDMTIALESAEEMGMMTPGLKLAKTLYEQLASEGQENSGTQALFKLYDR